MKTYRNRRTGIEFSTPCECTGDEWEEIGAVKPVKASSKKSGTKVAPVQQTDKDKGNGDE